jgi:uncharacterized OB-fold protein
MTMTTPPTPSAPVPHPVPDGDSRPYWEGVTAGELRIQRCQDCVRAVFYPRALCPHCSSTHLTWERASGHGTIYSYTVVHQAYGPFAGQVPFVVALIDLEEGVRLLSRIAGARESVQIGAPVHVVFERVDDELTLPYFALD